MKLRIDGRATIKDDSLTGGTVIDNETVEVGQGDVIVSDGPVALEIVSNE
jgi:hypothetical protein